MNTRPTPFPNLSAESLKIVFVHPPQIRAGGCALWRRKIRRRHEGRGYKPRYYSSLRQSARRRYQQDLAVELYFPMEPAAHFAQPPIEPSQEENAVSRYVDFKTVKAAVTALAAQTLTGAYCLGPSRTEDLGSPDWAQSPAAPRRLVRPPLCGSASFIRSMHGRQAFHSAFTFSGTASFSDAASFSSSSAIRSASCSGQSAFLKNSGLDDCRIVTASVNR